MGVPSFPSAELLVFWGGRQMGFDAFGHNPVEYAVAVRCPILFLHGSGDPRARPAEGLRVYDAVPGKKWFREMTGVAHESYVSASPETCTRRLPAFSPRPSAPITMS